MEKLLYVSRSQAAKMTGGQAEVQQVKKKRLSKNLHSRHAPSSHKRQIVEKDQETQTGIYGYLLNVLRTLKMLTFQDQCIRYQFILVDVRKHLIPLASAMLDCLKSLTENSILMVDDISAMTPYQIPNMTTLLFISSEAAVTMEPEPEHIDAIFILESDKDKADFRQRFDNGEDLIFQLADEIYRCYKEEARALSESGDSSRAKEREDLASRIFTDLKKAYKSVSIEHEPDA